MSKRGARVTKGGRVPTVGPTAFAAFIDLRDSTFVWAQDAVLAEYLITKLAELVVGSVAKWSGEIGNFTGDGFLVLFPQAELAVRGLAELIDLWEPIRQETKDQLGVPLPDEQSLILRTGIAFGFYRAFTVAGRTDVAGEAINRASRCEGASKSYYGIEMPDTALEARQRVFVTQNVVYMMKRAKDFWCSSQIVAPLKGYERLTKDGATEFSEQIVALWPKAQRKASTVEKVSKARLFSAADLESQVEVAVGLLAAAQQAHLGPSDLTTESSSGQLERAKDVQVLYSSAISAFERLRSIGGERLTAIHVATITLKLAEGYLGQSRLFVGAEQASSLARAVRLLLDSSSATSVEGFVARSRSLMSEVQWHQSIVLIRKERASKLREAESAVRAALAAAPIDRLPREHAAALDVLGKVLRLIAEGLAGKECTRRLDEAVEAHRSALEIWSRAITPLEFAKSKSLLAEAFSSQSDLGTPDSRKERLELAIATYGEALHVYETHPHPFDHAMTQNALGIAYCKESSLFSDAKALQLLTKGIRAFKQAERVVTREMSPEQYAAVQNNLGNSLRDLAYNSPVEKSGELFEKASAAYEAALSVWTIDTSPRSWAGVSLNLGNTYRSLARRAKPKKRKVRLDGAIALHRAALTIFDADSSPVGYAGAQHALGLDLELAAKFAPKNRRKRLLAEARAALEAALLVFTKESYPKYFNAITTALGEIDNKTDDV